MLRSAFNFFIFSSLFIALCAVIMVYQLPLSFPALQLPRMLYAFVFFSTICSYNFHWYLSNQSLHPSERLRWALRYKWIHLLLYLIGLAGSVITFIYLKQHWLGIAIAAFFTFLYSAPKIPQRIFIGLRKVAVGKTVFLAVVWTYVSTVLPILIAGAYWRSSFTWLTGSRFFLIYAICILFDYRDREDDRAAGVKSMITWFNERGINLLFVVSMALYLVFTLLLYGNPYSVTETVMMLVPGLVLAILYGYAKKHFSDYLYYFVLDGLMMLSSVLLILVHI